jgi:hypothetical protein
MCGVPHVLLCFRSVLYCAYVVFMCICMWVCMYVYVCVRRHTAQTYVQCITILATVTYGDFCLDDRGYWEGVRAYGIGEDWNCTVQYSALCVCTFLYQIGSTDGWTVDFDGGLGLGLGLWTVGLLRIVLKYVTKIMYVQIQYYSTKTRGHAAMHAPHQTPSSSISSTTGNEWVCAIIVRVLCYPSAAPCYSLLLPCYFLLFSAILYNLLY